MRTVSRWTIGAALAAAFTTFGSFSLAQVKAPAREAAADLPGVHLWFTDSGGSGAPVVFVHAATGSSRVWEYQRPVFARAAIA